MCPEAKSYRQTPQHSGAKKEAWQKSAKKGGLVKQYAFRTKEVSVDVQDCQGLWRYQAKISPIPGVMPPELMWKPLVFLEDRQKDLQCSVQKYIYIEVFSDFVRRF